MSAAIPQVDDPAQPEPSGEAWEAPLSSAPLAFVDFEMTGTDPAEARICEVAALRFEGAREVGRIASLVRAPAVGDSARIHGISDEALAGAPALEAVAAAFEEATRGAVVIGHRVGFDLAFWSAAAARGELEPPPTHALDTRALARRAWHRASLGLAALAEDLGLAAPSHRAEADARACAALFFRVAEELRAQTARQLWQAQRHGKPIRFRDDVAAALREGLERGRAVRIAYRVPGRHAFVDELEIRGLTEAHAEGRLRERGIVKTLRGDRVLWAELA